MATAPTGIDWTDEENDILVADYFVMLGEELAGRPYVKAHHEARYSADMSGKLQLVGAHELVALHKASPAL
jgi:hypothetical protein